MWDEFLNDNYDSYTESRINGWRTEMLAFEHPKTAHEILQGLYNAAFPNDPIQKIMEKEYEKVEERYLNMMACLA